MIILSYFSKRSKRARKIFPKHDLYLEYLVVIDSTVYNNLKLSYGSNLPDSILTEYIKIFFSQMVTGVSYFKFYKLAAYF